MTCYSELVSSSFLTEVNWQPHDASRFALHYRHFPHYTYLIVTRNVYRAKYVLNEERHTIASWCHQVPSQKLTDSPIMLVALRSVTATSRAILVQELQESHTEHFSTQLRQWKTKTTSWLGSYYQDTLTKRLQEQPTCSNFESESFSIDSPFGVR